MRTKALLGLAALAASAVAATAANVYSLNVVGYVNKSYVEGFNLFATPLDFDGTGAANTVTNIYGTTLPYHSQVYTWSGTGFSSSTWNTNFSGVAAWRGAGPSLDISPGRAHWLQIGTGSLGGTGQGTGTPGTATFVGTVLQGSLVNSFMLPDQFDFVGSKAPLAGKMQTDLFYVPKFHDVVYKWSATAPVGYTTYTYNTNFSGVAAWRGSAGVGVEPPLSVGEGVWLRSQPGASWTQNFTVQ